MPTRTKGFSLVEIVVVITILSILLMVAMPKFGDHYRAARVAKVNALGGAIETAAGLAKSTALASGVNCAAPGVSVTFETRTVTLNYCYPQALPVSTDGILQAANLDMATDGFTLSGGGPLAADRLTLTVLGAADPANCSIAYTAPAAAHGAYAVALATSGC